MSIKTLINGFDSQKAQTIKLVNKTKNQKAQEVDTRGGTRSENDNNVRPKICVPKSDPKSAVNFHEKSYPYSALSPWGRKFFQFSKKMWKFSSKIGQFCANFTRKLPFYHNFLPLQCSSVQFRNFLPLQCTSWTTLRKLIFAGTNFCGSQFWDFLRELNFADFPLERQLEPFCDLFDLCFWHLENFAGT